MKITVSSNIWKKAVSQALSLVNKKSSNPNETCIGINTVSGISGDIVELWVLETGVHNSKLYIPNCSIENKKDTVVFIQAASLEKLNKVNIEGKLNITFEDGKVVYSLEDSNLGSISEPIFHNQEPFKGMGIAVEESVNISEGVNDFISSLKNAIKYSVDRDINIVLDEGSSYIAGGISLSADFKQIFSSKVKDQFSLRTDLVKKLSFLLEEDKEIDIPLVINKSNNTLTIRSYKGEAILNIGQVNSARIQGISLLDSSDLDSKFLINGEELKKVIKWQSYNAEDGDTIYFESKEEILEIKGNKADKPSCINYGEIDRFEKISLPTEALLAATNFFNSKEGILEVKQIRLNVGEITIKYLVLVIEEDNYKTIIYIGEPAKYK